VVASVTTTSARLLSGARIEVPDVLYKCDLELHDRFQTFSSELLKLALAGIGADGLFVSLLAREGTNTQVVQALQSPAFLVFSALSLLAFASSVLFALLHRFIASDGLYYHVRSMKALILLEELEANPSSDFVSKRTMLLGRSDSDEQTRNQKLKNSEIFLQAGGIMLVVGAVLLGVVFVTVLI
jgi:hypothetical protein